MRNPDPTRSAEWIATARAEGIKLTHQRLEIFRELAAREEHPDAETLFKAVGVRVPTMSLDTVDRPLWLLHDLGLVATLGPRREAMRFDVNPDRHHHDVCARCGLIRDLESDELNLLPMPAALRELGGVLEARVGVCVSCEDGARTDAETETETETNPPRRSEP